MVNNKFQISYLTIRQELKKITENYVIFKKNDLAILRWDKKILD
jgi:hypothetical protein